VLFFVLNGLFASVVLSVGIDVTEKIEDNGEEASSRNNNNNNEQNSETSVSSTNNNATTYKNNWSSAPQPEDIQRIITPVVMSPHADWNKNFSASPMLDAIYNPEYYQPNHEHFLKAALKHSSHNSGHHYSSKEEDDGQKKHQYSQPLPPDLFLTQQYLKIQQLKEQERSNKQSFPKPALPEGKSNGYSFNSDSISYKPLKFDTDLPSILFSSGKGGSSMTKGGGYDNKESLFQYTLPTPTKGNTHPYPYQNQYSSSETEVEPPTTSSSSTAAKQHHASSWVDGYKTGITNQEG
jgi:hypothetical protein